jgi:hypothetical protein
MLAERPSNKLLKNQLSVEAFIMKSFFILSIVFSEVGERRKIIWRSPVQN